MSTQYANVIVHVSADLNPGERAAIERAVAAQPGVGRATASTRAARLFLVDYDPFTTTAHRILEAVRGRGVNAQLVGM